MKPMTVTTKQKWLWFIGLYVGSVAIIGGSVFLLRLLIPH